MRAKQRGHRLTAGGSEAPAHGGGRALPVPQAPRTKKERRRD